MMGHINRWTYSTVLIATGRTGHGSLKNMVAVDAHAAAGIMMGHGGIATAAGPNGMRGGRGSNKL